MFFRDIKNIFQFFIFSNLFVASCVTALCLSSEILLESKNYHLSIFVFFSTIVVYNFQRIVRIRKGIQHLRAPWLKTNNKTIIFLISISTVISLYYFLSFNYKTQFAIIFCGIISILYPFRLRVLPFLKVFIISIVWAVSTFLLLVLENNIVFNFNSLIYFLGRLFFVFAITIPFDIRDLKFDMNHLKTIPVFFGEVKARIIAVTFLMFSQALYLFLFFSSALHFHFLIGIVIAFLISAIFIVRSTREKSEMYFSFGVESTSIIFYLILVISSCIV